MFILDAVKVTACPKKKGLKNFIILFFELKNS